MEKYSKNKEKYERALQEFIQDETVTLTYLENKYGFRRATFSKYLKDNGIEVKKRGRSTEYERRQKEAIKLYQDGKSIRTLAKELNLSEKSLGLYFNQQNVEIRDKPQWKNIEYHLNEDFFETIDSEEKAYWFGFIMADGNVRTSRKNYRLTIELQIGDKNHIQKFLDAIGSNHLIKVRTRRGREYASMVLNSKKLVCDLIEKGCIPNKTYNGYIKENVLIDYTLKTSFLRGYLDGDGHISKQYRIEYVVKNDKLSYSIHALITSLGICSFIKYEETMQDPFNYHKEKRLYSIYKIYVKNKNNFLPFIKMLYQNAKVYLDRKYATYLEKCPSS